MACCWCCFFSSIDFAALLLFMFRCRFTLIRTRALILQVKKESLSIGTYALKRSFLSIVFHASLLCKFHFYLFFLVLVGLSNLPVSWKKINPWDKAQQVLICYILFGHSLTRDRTWGLTKMFVGQLYSNINGCWWTHMD